MTKKIFVRLGFVLICLVWGSTWLAIKVSLEYIPPFLSAGVRFIIASMILFAIIRIRKLRVPFSRGALKTYFAVGILTFSISFALVYWGEQFIPSSLASILFGGFPFAVALCFHFFSDDEKLDRFKVAGIVTGFIGIVIVFGPGLTWTGKEGMLGMAAVILSMILQAFALLPVKKYGKEINPVVTNFVGVSIAAVFLIALSLIFERDMTATWNATSFGAILYLAVMGSVVAFVTYYWLLKHLEAVYLSLSNFVNPILAVILGAVVLKEQLAPSVAVGTVFVLIGILTANGKAILAKVQSRNA